MKESLERKLTDLLVGLKIEQEVAEVLASDFINTNFNILNVEKYTSEYSRLFAGPKEPSIHINRDLTIPFVLYDRLTEEMKVEAAKQINPNVITIEPNEYGYGATIRHRYLLPVENSQRVIPEIVRGKGQ